MPTLPQVGTDFAGYRLEAVLARTNMSVVYVAEHPRLGSSVALKVIAPEIAEDDRFRERFVRESKMVAKLRHPNVIPIHDAGPWNDLLYIAMLYVSGADLRKVLRQHGRLTPDQTLLLLSQAGRALDAAHRSGLIHRDVKPGNMLIERGMDDDPDHVYVSDFGITKQTQSHTGLTMTGQYVGTIDYIAPEQVIGKDVDGRADLYSLGCVVYECVTGQTPFPRETEAAVIYAHMNDHAVPPSELVAGLPSQVDAVIARAMAKNPDERYETCRELIEALAGAYGLSGSKPVDARTVISADIGRGVETRRSDRQESGQIRDTGSVRRIEGGREDVVADPPFSPPPPPVAQRSRWWLWVAAVVVIAFAAGVGSWLGLRNDNSTANANGGKATSSGPNTTPASSGPTPGQMMLIGELNQANTSKTDAVGHLGPCKAGKPPIVTCSPPSTDDTDHVIFATYPSLTSLYAAYMRAVRQVAKQAGSSNEWGSTFTQNTGACSQHETLGESSWNHNEQHLKRWTIQQMEDGPPLQQDKQAAGRVFCIIDDLKGFYHVIWTQNNLKLLGSARGSTHRSTYIWWFHVHHNIGPMV